MSLESSRDQISIETPEQVSLRLPVAGLGSRFLALFADSALQAVAYALFIVLIVLIFSNVPVQQRADTLSDRATAWTAAILIFLHFLAFWGYFALFEGLWRGQTPGKKLFKLRVIKDSGRQVTLVEAMTRNLLRVVDLLPGMYLIGTLSILISSQRKRLGDLAAGTLVVHASEQSAAAPADLSRTFTAGLFPTEPAAPARETHTSFFSASELARLSSADLVLLDTFFARIPDLPAETREKIEEELLQKLCAKMQVEKPASEGSRALLDSIAYDLRNQTALRG